MYELSALEASLTSSIYAGKLHYAQVTGSTNTDALAAARSGAPHGTVYFTDEQTAGRGRGDHAWHSAPAQGVYVSVLVRPALASSRLPLLPLAAGLAAAEAIRAVCGLSVDLRWPNDLLLGERKTGGILAEAQADAGMVSYAVIGIGINVHQSRFQPGLATPATSLDLETGRYISRQELLVALLESLERETRALLDPTGAEAIPERVERASTWVRGRRVEVHGPQACAGTTDGLDENGFLLVRTPDGLVRVQTGGIRAA